MVKRTPWVERKFNFSEPVGLYPCLIERLRGAPARLEEVVSQLSQEKLTAKNGDKWSVQEHAGHLYEVDALHINRLGQFEAGLDKLVAADMSNQSTEEADYNRNTLSEVLSLFRDRRMAMVKRLETKSEAEAAQSALHPRLNTPMRLIDMVLFTAEHDDHHFAMIRELTNS